MQAGFQNSFRGSQELSDPRSVHFLIGFCDGRTSPEATNVAQSLKSTGFTLSILGVGTTDGAPIPFKTGGFVTDNRGKIAIPQLEEKDLQVLARIGGGKYARITDNDDDLDLDVGTKKSYATTNK